MGGCCSCLDAIRGGGKYSSVSSSSSPSTEMTSSSTSNVPPPTHGISRAMSSPTIRIRGGGREVSGSGLALGVVPVEQDAAYWEWHVSLPGLPRPPPGEDDDDDDDDEFHDVGVDGNDDCEGRRREDPYALKFGVATRKDRSFYRNLEDASGDDPNPQDDGTVLMRPVSDLRHGDVIGVAVQQSDLPMIQILLNGEPLAECTINRFRGTVYPAIYVPPGAPRGREAVGIRERLEDGDDDGGGGGFALSVVAEFDEENFKEMSPHARFGPLLAARGII